MAGRLLSSFCLGFLLLTQTCASPIPQSGSASSGTGQDVATSQDGTTGDAAYSDTPSDGTTGGASTGTSTGTTGSTSNPGDTTSSPQSSGGATEAPSTSAGYTSSPPSSEATTEAQTPPNGSVSTTSSGGGSSSSGGNTYLVVDDDDCETIAEKSSVSTLLLLQANGITDGCHSLHAGDSLTLPEQCHTYKVKTGDTCYSITQRLSQALQKQVPVEMFQKWNQ